MGLFLSLSGGFHFVVEVEGADFAAAVYCVKGRLYVHALGLVAFTSGNYITSYVWSLSMSPVNSTNV